MKQILTTILTLGLIFSTANAGQFNSVVEIGDPMPTFDLPTADGGQLASDDLQGDVVVLVSLANHCPWVKGMDGDLVKLVDEFDGQSVEVVGFAVNRREDDQLPAMAEHGERVGYNFPYVYDDSQEIGRALGATRTPEYFVYDADRKLVYTGLLYDSPAKMNGDGSIRHINGEPSIHYVANAIDATLDGEAVDPAETRAHGCSVNYE